MHYPVAIPEPITRSKVLKAALLFVLTLPVCAIVAIVLSYRLSRKLFTNK